MCVYHLFLLCVSLGTALGDVTEPIDLTHHFDKQTQYWFGSSPFHFTRVGEELSPEGFWLASNDFEAGEHGGTHMDAPYHFCREGWKIGEIPFERFYGEAVLINATEEAAADPDYTLGVDKLTQWEEINGPIPEASIVLIDYGWANKYTNWSQYFGSHEMNISTLHFPGLSEEAAQWMVRSGRVYGVGSDTPSVDPGQSKDFMAHRILSRDNIFILENIALNGTTLPDKGFHVFALPMKIRYGTGAPCRVVAVP